MATKKEPHDIRLAATCPRYAPPEGRAPLKKTCLSCAWWKAGHCKLGGFAPEEARRNLEPRMGTRGAQPKEKKGRWTC
ncbi:MAG: hypothetical protein LBO03_04355 [Acidaminococcales bacterium]|nr:hypothetical protein [Acidaminococcales bacterium]